MLLSLCVLAPGGLHAAPPEDSQPERRSLELARTSNAWLLGELGVASALLGTSIALTRSRPDDCRWCRSNGFDEGVRGAFLAARPREAGMVSDIAVVGVLPSFALGALLAPAYQAGERRHALENVVIVATSTGLSLAVATGLKNVFARERPAEHHGALSRSPAAQHPGERYLSFYSSHAAAAFAVASSATTVSYLRGYSSAPYVAVLSGGLAAGVGVLRIAADMHWATDVLVGAGMGTLAGVSVPLLLHQREPGSFGVAPSVGRRSGGLVVSGSF